MRLDLRIVTAFVRFLNNRGIYLYRSDAGAPHEVRFEEEAAEIAKFIAKRSRE